MSNAPEVRVAHSGAITEITIDRDHRRNALSTSVCAAIADGVDAAAARDDARVIVLRGAGRAFCAGADLDGAHIAEDFHAELRRMLTTMQDCPLIIIADIQGPTVGAGMQLAMAADLRVVGQGAWFQVPPVKLGIAVDPWTIRRAQVLLGGARSRTLLLAAARMDVAGAVACGFASYEGDSARADELADEISRYAPMSLRYHKMVLNDDGVPTEAERELYQAVWASADAAEAAAARAERRAPVFRGK
ncbi:enoyl-CoA hydratase [Corynebacterium sp. TAE3-ERU12]|uniref:enoyl-CoA hydratase n=1 Tax=Corynebacterium sp. TAE3-ERU12 TaxID=2849491 RepID=UPI001C44BE77|nr:enoyl-CoA hydratase [Corynebacterium sp. TAE3-ERU12]MBV7295563.1 enoyl-CoA hydratase [Corynebacterium sp. TAE3-ERU12]